MTTSRIRWNRIGLLTLAISLGLIAVLVCAGVLVGSAQQAAGGASRVSVIHQPGEYVISAPGPGGYSLHIDEKRGVAFNITDASGSQRYAPLNTEQGGLAGIGLQGEPRAFLYLLTREGNTWKALFGAAPAPEVTVSTTKTADGVRVDAIHPDGCTLSYLCRPDTIQMTVSNLPKGQESRLGFQFATGWQPVALGANGNWQWPSAWNGGYGPAPHPIVGDQFDLLFGSFSQDISLHLPAPASVNWQYMRPCFWRVGPAVYGTLPVQNEQPVTLAFPPARPMPREITAGLFAYRAGDPVESAQVQVTLPLQVKAGEPATLQLSRPVTAAIPNGQFFVFYSPEVAAALQAQIDISYQRVDRSASSWRLLPLQAQSETQYTFTVPTDFPIGPLALRFLVAEPGDAAQLRTGRLLTVFPEHRWDLPYGREHGLRGDVVIAVSPGAVATASTLTASLPAIRSTYQQGEIVEIALRSAAPIKSPLAVHWEQVGGISGTQQLPASARRVLLDTAGLPMGSYHVTISSGPQSTASTDFMLTGAMPGAPFIKANIGSAAEAIPASRFGVNVWMETMFNANGLERPYATPDSTPMAPWLRKLGLPVAGNGGEDIFDSLLGVGVRYFVGSHNRYSSFSFAHTLPVLTETARRKRLLEEQELRDTPAMAGHLLDFDAIGLFSGNFGDEPGQANRMIAEIRKTLEAKFADSWAHQPESQLPPDSPEAKQAKAAAWVRFLSTVMESEYAAEVADFRRVDPSLRDTTSLTADHSPFNQGEWLPNAYRPLDLRYMTVWSDQVYCYSHWDLQHLLWQDTVRAADNKTPQWTTAPISPETDVTQHMRMILELYGRGAQGVGFSDEAPTLNPYAESGSPIDQGARMSGQLVKQFGPLFRQTSYRPQVAILYSEGQGVSGWANWAYGTPLTVLYNALALNNVPATFITERSIAAGGLKAFRALVITNQTVPLPAPAQVALTAWQQAGGAIYADATTTIPLPDIKPLGFKVDTLTYTERSTDAGDHFYAFAAKNRQVIRDTFGAYDGLPVVEDTRALLTPLSGGDATYLVAANNARFDWDPMLPNDTKLSGWYLQTIKPGWLLYSRDARQPIQLSLPFRGAKPAVIYPLLGREAALDGDKLNMDFRNIPGEIYCLLPRPIGPVAVRAQCRRNATEIAIEARGTDGKPLAAAIPVQVTLNGTDIYLATDATGHAVTHIPHNTPPATLTVTELLSGQATTIPVSRAKEAAVTPVSAGATVTVYDRENIRGFLRKKEPVLILLDPEQQSLRDTANRLAQIMARQGRAATVLNKAEYGPLPQTWEPNDEQQKAIGRVKAGDVLGWRTPVSRMWYDLNEPRTAVYRDVVLLGNPSTNRFISDLQSLRLLPRRLTADYPEPGAAVLEYAVAPFAYGYDALVIGGSSDAGVRAGVEALAQHVAGKIPLPDDVITRRIRQAREDSFAAIGVPTLQPRMLDFQATWNRLGASAAKCAAIPLPRLADNFSVRLGIMAISPNGNYGMMALNRLGSNLVAYDPKTGAIRWTRASTLAYPTWMQVGDDGAALVGDGIVATYFAPDGTGQFRIQTSNKMAMGRAYLSDGQIWVPQQSVLLQLDGNGKEVRRLSVADPTPGGTKGAPWTVAVGTRANRVAAVYTAAEHADWWLIVADFDGNIIWQLKGVWEPLLAFAPDGSLVVAEHGQWGDRTDLDGPGTAYTRLRWFSPAGKQEAERLINRRAADLAIMAGSTSAVVHVPEWPALKFERANGLLTVLDEQEGGTHPTTEALAQAQLATPFAESIRAFGAIPIVSSPDMLVPRPPTTIELAKFRWFNENYDYTGQPLTLDFPKEGQQYDFTITTSGYSPTKGEFTIFVEDEKGRRMIGNATAHNADGSQWSGRLTAPAAGPHWLRIFYTEDNRRIHLGQLILKAVE